MPPKTHVRRALAVFGVCFALATAIAALGFVSVRRLATRGTEPPSSIVRVVLPGGTGTGFFVNGPDDLAYVATAYHVVSSGEPILIERTLDAPASLAASRGSGGLQRYVEAYPETEIVAFDADADLAIVRLANVTRDHFRSLPLAREVAADENVLSYGYPGSSLAHRFGMVSKPGKVLSLVRFPVSDPRTGEVLRDDAVEGLLISADIEPGFSGGPTCNERGELVGVNVTKDLAHRGQNGAVSVVVLRALLARITPAREQKDPTAAEVSALLSRVEREYLLLPIERRAGTPADDFVSEADLPRAEEFSATLRRLENDTTRDPTTNLSGQASLGLTLARLPGHPLETYQDRSTRAALAACELRERGLREFFGGGKDDDPTSRAAAARLKCSELAFRPVVWDMTALALQWEGKERELSVAKVSSVDPDRHAYRASVRFGQNDHLVDVWVSTSGGRVRVKLFDSSGHLFGLSAERSTSPSAVQGTWRRSEPRTAHDIAPGVDSDVDTNESLMVAVGTDGAVSVTHQYRRHVTMTGERRLACGGAKLDLGLEQSFEGAFEGGSVTALRRRDAKPLGADMGRCWRSLAYVPDQAVVLKVLGDKLLMYRTDGASYPEVAEFTRVADPAP